MQRVPSVSHYASITGSMHAAVIAHKRALAVAHDTERLCYQEKSLRLPPPPPVVRPGVGTLDIYM